VNRLYIVFLLISLMIPFELSASPGLLTGKVVDELGRPVPDVYVQLNTTALYSVTKTNGLFEFKNVPTGKYTVYFRHVSFLPAEINITISAQSKLDLGVITLQHTVLSISPMLVTASRNDPTLKIPQSVNILTASTIRDREAQTAAEALRQETGLAVQKTNHGGGSAIIRGMSSNHILILVDGIRMNNALYRLGNHQYLTTVDDWALQRIEVMRGPGSLLFGSDALGGAINLITTLPDTSAAVREQFNVNARFSTADFERTLHSDALVLRPRWNFVGGFSHKQYGNLRRGGFSIYPQLERSGTSLVQSPSGFTGYDFNLKFNLFPAADQRMTLAYQRSRQFDVPRYDKYENNGYYLWKYDPQERDLGYIKYSAERLEWGFFDQVALTLSVHRQGEGRVKQFRPNAKKTNEYDDDLSKGLQLLFKKALFQKHKLTYGLDFYSEDIHSQRSKFDPETGLTRKSLKARYPDGALYRSGGVYIMDSWRQSHSLQIESGLRYSLIQTRFSTADSSFSKINLQFRSVTGSAGFSWIASERWILKSRLAQGFRAPNLSDLAKFGQSKGTVFEIPNYNLLPEKLVSAEATVGYRAGRLRSELTAYYSYIYDILSSVPALYLGRPTIERDGQVFSVHTKMNNGRGYIRGLEFRFNYNLTAHSGIDGNLTDTFGQNITKQEPLSKIQPTFGMLRYYHRSRGVHQQFYLRFALKQDRLSSDDLSDPRIPAGGTPGWYTLNYRISFSAGPNIRLHLSMENIMDFNYREHASGINAPGRNLIISGDYRF